MQDSLDAVANQCTIRGLKDKSGKMVIISHLISALYYK
jgi:hypothetical protein